MNPEEIRRQELERDRLLQVNCALPGHPSSVPIAAPCLICGQAGNPLHECFGCIKAERDRYRKALGRIMGEASESHGIELPLCNECSYCIAVRALKGS